MLIRLDNGKSINVVEKCLTVINGKLYNTDTQQYEGLDGDKVEFYFTNQHGHQCWVRGTVDGYTCNRRIKLQDVNELYATSLNSKKIINHISKVVDCGNMVVNVKEIFGNAEEVNEDDLAAVLCAQ